MGWPCDQMSAGRRWPVLECRPDDNAAACRPQPRPCPPTELELRTRCHVVSPIPRSCNLAAALKFSSRTRSAGCGFEAAAARRLARAPPSRRLRSLAFGWCTGREATLRPPSSTPSCTHSRDGQLHGGQPKVVSPQARARICRSRVHDLRPKRRRWRHNSLPTPDAPVCLPSTHAHPHSPFWAARKLPGAPPAAAKTFTSCSRPPPRPLTTPRQEEHIRSRWRAAQHRQGAPGESAADLPPLVAASRRQAGRGPRAVGPSARLAQPAWTGHTCASSSWGAGPFCHGTL